MDVTDTTIKQIEENLGAYIDGVSIQSLPLATIAELATINSLVIRGVILATDVGIVEVNGIKSICISSTGIDKLLKFDAQLNRTPNEYKPSDSVILTGVLQA